MGSVKFTRQFFDAGPLQREQFRAAQTAASQQIQDLPERFRGVRFDRVLGSSGTALAVSALLRHLDLTDGRVDYASMKKLRRMMIDDPRGDWFAQDIVREDRLKVLAGGLSILMAIHRTLGLESMRPSQGALREGVLYDQVGRVGREEVMARTVDRMVDRFAADPAQAARVESSAMQLIDQIGKGWDVDSRESRRVLHWASRLHEAGLSVAHAGYHRHGAYLVAESDMPGFSVDDQALVAAVIRNHRRKIRYESFADLPSQRVESALRLAVIFRLAVLLNRGRVEPPRPCAALSEDQRGLTLGFDTGWLEEHPLTVADLAEEAELLRAIEVDLEFGPRA
jgi:exopolyphosphatase/guanosine-5'-triphosphate,3'-diphosphate pyrophosphatase